MATSKLQIHQSSDLQCSHDGGIRYWCRECAFEAAMMLRDENLRLRAEVHALRELTAGRPRLKK